MRHISTLHGLAERSASRGREANLAELAHLERERATLERKLKVLTNSLEHAEHHLGEVLKRIAVREQALYEGQAPPGPAAQDLACAGEEERVGRREVSLEY
jgi:hypothetical protein